ncbi:MAG: amidohydrolase [Actinobacteria bacterium]|nr:amidohydrolase [Actinomycetota bacterium]
MNLSDVEKLKVKACALIDKNAETLVNVSHEIHDHPEQNYEEVFASELLTRTANDQGVHVELGAFDCATGFSGDVGSGPTVCIMSEYDALPDIGHGCGHNIIAAAGLGAAIALASIAEASGGRVRYMGTPAEEGGGGKILMARNGALAGVDLAMMVHPADADLVTIDAIALQQLLVEYTGQESHAAAAPHLGRNALDAAVLGYMAVATLRQHIMPTERIHGIFLKSGEKPNIVPREASSEWYVRSDNVTSLAALKPRVLASLESGAHACGCSVSHEWIGTAYADMVTNNTMGTMYAHNALTLGRTVTDPRHGGHRVVGSTDMGNVSHLVPSIHPMIASAPAGTSIHTKQFAQFARSPMADQAVLDGAKAMAMTAIDFWTSSERQQAVAAEFQAASTDKNVL